MKNRTTCVVTLGIVIFLALGCATVNTNQEKANDHMAIGAAFMKSGQYTDALREFFKAEKLTPHDPVLHYYIGIAYLAKEARDKAMMEFQKAVRLNPEYSEAHNYIGTLYLDNNQLDPAIASFDRALANILYDTPAVSLYNKGLALYKKGDHKGSIACYKQALKTRDSYPLLPPLEKNMGLSYLALGQYADAAIHLNEALAKTPDYAEAKYWLAVVKVRQKQYSEASKLLQEVVREAPQSEYGVKAKDMLVKIQKGRYEDIKQDLL